MEKKPHTSLPKRMFHKILKLAKKREQSREQMALQPGDAHSSLEHHSDRSPVASQGTNHRAAQSVSIPSLSIPSTLSTPGSLPAAPQIGPTALAGDSDIGLASQSSTAILGETENATQSPPLKSMQTAKNVGKAILGLLSSAAEGIPVPGVKGIFDTMIKVICTIEATQTNQEALNNLEARLKTMIDTVITPMKNQRLSEIPDVSQGLDDFERGLVKLLTDVENQLKSSKISRAINHLDNMAVIMNIEQKITQFLDLYSVKLLAHGITSNYDFHQSNSDMQAIEKLPWVRAAYDHMSHGQDRALCFMGTRDQLLTEIKAWIHDLDVTTPIYVLYGIAGIGKTTVAQTIAQYAANQRLLGASFFFSRLEDERKSGYFFFATLAFQLALYDANIRGKIAAALVAEPDLPQKSLEIQIKCLILDPLQGTQVLTQPILLVVDAMDECLPAHAKTILQLLAKNIGSVPTLKVFITTRPESHIQAVLTTQSLLQPFYLHEIERSVAMGDIQLFLEHALSKEQVIAALEYSQWEPTKEELKALTKKCGILFIMATTAVRYILDEAGKPELQMNRLLYGLDIMEEEDGVMSSLDGMYLEILKSSIPKRYSSEFLQDFQKVVGIIIVLEDLLPLSALAQFLEMNMLDIQTALRNLHSIMAPTSNSQAPQVYHKSFPDFVTDRERCKDIRFYISPPEKHANAAQYCLRIMNRVLHSNKYGLQGLQKYMSNAEILLYAHDKIISDELKYSCLYWANHLSQSRGENSAVLLELLNEFTLTHLLHWIEVLSYIEKLEIAHPAMKLAQQVLVNWTGPQVPVIDELLNDGSRCVTKFYEIIKKSAQHIYYSALPFMPVKSQIFQRFGATSPDSIDVVTGQEVHWNHLLATLQGHLDSVNSIDFSPDGSRLASGSGDGIVKLWDGSTGACVATVDSHSDAVTTVVFSPNGSMLATGSDDGTINLWDWSKNGPAEIQMSSLNHGQGAISTISFSPNSSYLASNSWDSNGHINIWNVSTAAYIGTLKNHLGAVTCVVFSPDGSRLASSSYDHRVILWDWISQVHINILEGHSEAVTTLAFSPDGSMLASGSEESNIILWDGTTGAYILTLSGHSDAVSFLKFSSDGSTLASGSQDGTVILWNGSTGDFIFNIEAHLGTVNTIAFSPDNSVLASASEDTTIKVWDRSTGTSVAILEGHLDSVYTIAFSPDGKKLASGSEDKTVRMWDRLGEKNLAVLNRHLNSVHILTFSPEISRWASGSWDGTVKLWDKITGSQIATLEDHSGIVCAVEFSYNGSRLASGSYGGTVKLWNGITGDHIADLAGHSNAVYIVKFSPDGSRLVSVSRVKTIKLWDGYTGAYLKTLAGHKNAIYSLDFLLNGSKLVSQSDDGTFTWDGTTGELIQSKIQSSLSGFSDQDETNAENTLLAKNSEILNDSGNTSADGQIYMSEIFQEKFEVLSGAIVHKLSSVPVMWLPGEYQHPISIGQSQGIHITMGFVTGQVVLLDLSPLASYV